MCTLIALNQLHSDYPLIIASNRDEFYQRPTQHPQMLSQSPSIFGGRDLEKGGTWLALNGHGILCGLVNQRVTHTDPEAPSRGHLVLSMLQSSTVEDARRSAQKIAIAKYNPFHMLLADQNQAYVMAGHKTLHWSLLERGVSVLTNDGLNAPSFPKVLRIREKLSSLPAESDKLFACLMRLMADDWMPDDFKRFDGAGLDEGTQRALHAICVHTPAYGTKSSSIIALSRTGQHRYFHAAGSPREVPFEDLSGRVSLAVPSEHDSRL